MQNLLKNYTILYVEDDSYLQKNMQEYLNGFFKEVYIASNGKEGLEKYHLYKPDSLLLDIDLPLLDGLSLAKEIRKADKKISIVMLTAFSNKEQLLEATELKLLKYLIKPVNLDEFKKMLELLAVELSQNNCNCVALSQGYSWDKINKILYYNFNVIDLSVKEQKLLDIFISNRGKSVSFETIMALVWEDSFDRSISFNSVKNLVSSLRKKLPEGYIKNVYGKGYIFTPH